MTDFGEDWERYSSTHLGVWHGRSLALSAADGTLVSSTNYILSSTSVSLSQTNPSSLLLKFEIGRQSPTNLQMDSSQNDKTQLLFRYNLSSFHVFPDGSYSTDHNLLELPYLLPLTQQLAHHAIELAFPVSATERIRAFALYNESRKLHTVILLEEVRSGLFDTRAPLTLTSLLGEQGGGWKGLCETFRHEQIDQSSKGFGLRPSSASLNRKARPEYSDEDLPQELKNPSGGSNGIIKTKTKVTFGWDPAGGIVRRATVLRDMQDHDLGRSVIYGSMVNTQGGLFDMAKFETGSEAETIFLTLNNACYVLLPAKRIRGVPASAELCCVITTGYRRRIVRIYGKTGVSSESLSSESLA